MRFTLLVWLVLGGSGFAKVEVQSAVERSLVLLEASAAITMKEKTCFTCHHQGLQIMTFDVARDRGFPVNPTNFQALVTHTLKHLERGQKNYGEGRGQGGKADMAGYALWALDVGGQTPNETTDAVAGFLLSWQKDLGRWKRTANRPPTEASDFTTTYVSVYGLSAYGTEAQQEDIEARFEKVRAWLGKANPKETEDRVFHLRTLTYLDLPQDAAREALLGLQREDGGWAQTSEMESDAYATGTALVALAEAGLRVDDSAYQRGVHYLLETQEDDGSWQVVSRSKPFQKYFESGYPHGKNQFISSAAGSWATWALLLTLEE